jgi:hypothetical protein
LGGGDEFWSIVHLVAKDLVVGEDPPQSRIVVLALVEQDPNKLRMDKRVTPLPGRADALAQQRRDRRLEARIIAAVGATVVPAIDEFALPSL